MTDTEEAVVGDGGETEPPEERARVWPRALGLFALVTGMTVVPPVVLIGVPLVVMVLALPARRLGTVVAGVIAALFAFQGALREGLWYAERGWAILVGGWFVALTLRWPGGRFTSRALGAVAGATAVAAAVLMAIPESWSVIDWLMGERIRSEIMAGLALLRGPEDPLPESLVEGLYGMARSQMLVFPAVLAMASMAGLGVAWWAYDTLSNGRDGGLGPVREFGFDDKLVWLLIGGLALVLLGGEGGLERAGWNAVVFMGGLYALRGVAVAVFLTGGVSLLWGVVLAVGLLFLWPVIVVSAAMIGLGDTWLHLRERARGVMA